MCGIWGSISSTQSIPVSTAWQGLCSITDRGPDDWGIYTSKTGKIVEESEIQGSTNITIGNRRLSIFDLSSAGNQPMTNNGRHWIVYNGEICNHIELIER